MSEAKEELSGPDLSAGVPEGDLAPGVPLLGHANGEAVMLVRADDEIFATAATCTHYGGPLPEGLIVGKTVRCPLHHACFDLRTGNGKGPGLNPLPCFDVVNERGLVRVGKKRPEASPSTNDARAVRPTDAPTSVVVIGGGPAGAACAETLRRLGYTGPVTLVADEPPGPVDRPNLSKDYLAGNAPEEWMPLRDEGFYRDQKIDFVLGDGALRIDPSARVVSLESGRTLSYGALLLATGAEVRRLDIPGADASNVHVLRTLADSRAIIASAKAGARAVVIGSSFIGLEVAASLRARNVEVDVVGSDAVPLGRVVGDKLGAFVRSLHEAHGVKFHLGKRPSRIDGSTVVLDDGTTLHADFVVTGVGVSPRTALARAAGIDVDHGIVVDGRLRTNVDGVWAAGDVAAYPDPWSDARIRVEHFVVAQRLGQAAARSILGLTDEYRDVPFFWSAHYDTTLRYVGHAAKWDRILERGNLASGKYAAAFERAGKILAVVTVDEDHLSLEVEAAMESGDAARLRSLVEGR